MKNRLAGVTGLALLLGGVVEGCNAQVDTGYQGEPLVTLKGRVESLQLSAPETDVGVLWFTSDAENGCSGPQKSSVSSATGSYIPGIDPACTRQCDSDFPGYASDPELAALWEDCQHACGSDVQIDVSVYYNACLTGAVGQTAPVVGDFPAQFRLDMLRPPPAQALMPSDTGERVALGYFVALAPQEGALDVSFGGEPPLWLTGGSESHVLMYAADAVAAESSWGLCLRGEYATGYHLLRVAPGVRCGLPEEGEASPFPSSDSTPPPAGSSREPDSADSAGTQYPAADTGEADPGSTPDGAAATDEPLPDYSGVPFVCGNGVCEAPEDCDHCSDCACAGESSELSTGLMYGTGNYFCSYIPDGLAAAPPGSEAEITLKIAPLSQIEWPSL